MLLLRWVWRVVGVLGAFFCTGDRGGGGGGAGGVVGGREGVKHAYGVDSSGRQPGDVLESRGGRGFGVLGAAKGRRDVLV